MNRETCPGMHATIHNGLLATIAILAWCASPGESAAELQNGWTHPAKVGEWDFEKDLKKIRQQWGTISRVLRNEEIYSTSEASVSAWSCGQQAGHLVLALSQTADIIASLLDNPEQNADGQINEIGLSILTTGKIPQRLEQAPPQLNPENKSRKSLMAALGEAKKKWRALEGKADEIQRCAARAEHSIGMLKSSDWTRLMAIHNAHHFKIIAEILEASGKNSTEIARSVFGINLRVSW